MRVKRIPLAPVIYHWTGLDWILSRVGQAGRAKLCMYDAVIIVDRKRLKGSNSIDSISCGFVVVLWVCSNTILLYNKMFSPKQIRNNRTSGVLTEVYGTTEG